MAICVRVFSRYFTRYRVGALVAAMPGSTASSEASCPVLAAWSQSEVVIRRLAEKDLLIISGGKLSRQTVTANRDLLEPLINLVGPWPASQEGSTIHTMCLNPC